MNKDTTKIEEDGITALRNFISQSKMLSLKEKEKDKYPLWDGEIFVYRSSDHSNNNLRGRISIQIKSSNVKADGKETYNISKIILNKYYEDGGLILIRPMYVSTTEYSIFVKILLPITIKRLLQKSSDTASISFDLDYLPDYQSLEMLCFYYLDNKKDQITNMIHSNEISKFRKGDYTIVGRMIVRNGNFDESLFSDDSCFYFEKGNIKIPISDQLKKIEWKGNIDVRINNEIIFQNVLFRKESKHFEIILNPTITISLDGRLKFNCNEDSVLYDVFESLAFLRKLLIHKEITIDTLTISCIPDHESYDEVFRYYEAIEKIILMIRSDPKTIKIIDLNKNGDKINSYFETLVNKKQIIYESENKIDIKYDTIFNREIAFVLVRDNVLDNFNVECLFNSEINEGFGIVTNEDKEVPTSKYIIISNLGHIKSIDYYFKEAYEDLFKYYNEQALPSYTMFVLNCLNTYDLTLKKGFLSLAEEINDFLKKDEIQTINQFQIIKRQRKLNRDEIKRLLEIEKQFPDDKRMKCCIYIILEHYDQFEIEFETIDEGEQNEFRGWPIWNLYERRSIVSSSQQ